MLSQSQGMLLQSQGMLLQSQGMLLQLQGIYHRHTDCYHSCTCSLKLTLVQYILGTVKIDGYILYNEDVIAFGHWKLTIDIF